MTDRDHRDLRIMLTVSAAIFSLFVCVACARASGLPDGVTCSDVMFYASRFNIPDTTMGRMRAKIIAAALGTRLTNAQLDAAARCIRDNKR